ncbi:MAG TPA: bacillithiol biosynthesis cysteine-adding enzyme BshC [Candidatus Elarobacter sp.]|nr:bacillithiol biosynthesis cysteine-adding enzyme BshC [Candidatus Elarobacter sp.]
MIRVIDRKFSGAALPTDALAGALPQWYPGVQRDVADWCETASDVRADFSGREWLEPLLPAFGGTAIERLAKAARDGGVVVTTGQQPGLFGGPLYVLHKALTALELADAVARSTGVATAPVFWAATDDADFAEANHVGVVAHGALAMLEAPLAGGAGLSMAATPLGDVREQLRRLEDACGSAADVPVLHAVREAYGASGATVGGAYLALLRALLEPLGVAVLDAAHPVVRATGAGVLRAALERSADLGAALTQRTKEMRAAKYSPQVADVPALSLVFETSADGTRRRVPIREAQVVARRASVESLGPNVLLRPVMERAILPTVAYVGGPGEVSYFAQVSAVAASIGARAPRVVPRWSGTVIEPGVQKLLDELGSTVDDFVDPHAMESRVAREEVPAAVRDTLAALTTAVEAAARTLAEQSDTPEPLRRSASAMRATIERRIARLERRHAAMVKRHGSERLQMVAAARASLFPNGAPQERVLSFVPLLARYGDAAIAALRAATRDHAARLVARG